MKSWVFALVQFLPLSLFATYAFWNGVPSNDRWMQAFQLGAVAAVLQLAILIRPKRPLNRLILAGNLYLLGGGLAPLTQQWWLFSVYEALQESGIIIAMLLVGVISTTVSPTGYVGVAGLSKAETRRSSLILLAATALALVPAMLFEGNRLYAAVMPIVFLAVLHRFLIHRLNASAAIA